MCAILLSTLLCSFEILIIEKREGMSVFDKLEEQT